MKVALQLAGTSFGAVVADQNRHEKARTDFLELVQLFLFWGSVSLVNIMPRGST